METFRCRESQNMGNTRKALCIHSLNRKTWAKIAVSLGSKVSQVYEKKVLPSRMGSVNTEPDETTSNLGFPGVPATSLKCPMRGKI